MTLHLLSLTIYVYQMGKVVSLISLTSDVKSDKSVAELKEMGRRLAMHVVSWQAHKTMSENDYKTME